MRKIFAPVLMSSLRLPEEDNVSAMPPGTFGFVGFPGEEVFLMFVAE